ncbi:hypothetical protein GCM10023093_03490 [Nemorincola caseinilytica]|uniref:Beta-barrel porin n=2 Tax=Nemorincola caseinilytica TaxID=2054315 RepID=A0ABP8N3A3_9BACT
MLPLLCALTAWGQPSTLPMTPQRDTSNDKTNNGGWKNQEAVIHYHYRNSATEHNIDTGIHTFHRRLFIQPWQRDMGNPGSPVLNLLFTPEYRVGPTLGYHVYDVYRYNVDSLKYYNTNRPYSVFSYQMAGRQENIASIMHTQNIRPNWNVAVEYRKISSPGYYQVQRNNDDNFALSTNYKSLNKHYTLHGGMVYNKQQHDENGGVLYRDLLDSPDYNNRRILNTAYESPTYSTTRSTVANVQRDMTMMLEHAYTWGVTDTLWDEEDTAAYTYTLTPRFSISHNATMSTEQHSYKDLAPDSMRYTSLFQRSFPNKGNAYYSAGADSVFTRQKWFWVDNKVLFNGFFGKQNGQLQFSAGAGVRYDQFISDPVSKLIADSPYYRIGYDRRSMAGTYIEGNIRKEALAANAWEYGAALKLYTTGTYAGNFAFNALLGKRLKSIGGSFTAGAGQQLGSAPYSYTDYQNIYAFKFFDLERESITSAFAMLESARLRLSGGARGYIINNYIYQGSEGIPAQYTASFTLPQVWIRKVFRVGSFYLDNELVYQAVSASTPVNVPQVMGRHQLSFEKGLFHNAIKIATGVEARYNTAYTPAGYDAQFNRFFYQNYDTVKNFPELAVFFNFRIKRFRAFLTGENMQQLFARNAILFSGTPVRSRTTGDVTIPMYAMPNTMLRFGFSWAMVN